MAVTKPISMKAISQMLNSSTSNISLKSINTNLTINGNSFYRPGSYNWPSFLSLTKFETYTIGNSRYPIQPLLKLKADTADYKLGEWFNYNEHTDYPAVLTNKASVPDVIKYTLSCVCTVTINDSNKVMRMLGVSNMSEWGIAALVVMHPVNDPNPYFTYICTPTKGKLGTMNIKIESAYFAGGCNSLYIDGFIVLVFLTGSDLKSSTFKPLIGQTFSLVPKGLILSKIEPSLNSSITLYCYYKIILHFDCTDLSHFNPHIEAIINTSNIKASFNLLATITSDKKTRTLYEGYSIPSIYFYLKANSYTDSIKNLTYNPKIEKIKSNVLLANLITSLNTVSFNFTKNNLNLVDIYLSYS